MHGTSEEVLIGVIGQKLWLPKVTIVVVNLESESQGLDLERLEWTALGNLMAVGNEQKGV